MPGISTYRFRRQQGRPRKASMGGCTQLLPHEIEEVATGDSRNWKDCADEARKCRGQEEAV